MIGKATAARKDNMTTEQGDTTVGVSKADHSQLASLARSDGRSQKAFISRLMALWLAVPPAVRELLILGLVPPDFLTGLMAQMVPTRKDTEQND